MFKKVLILSASAGNGHVAAARALEQAFSQTHAAEDVRRVDMLEYTSPPFRFMFSDLYRRMADQAKGFWGWFYGGVYDYFDRPWRYNRLQLALTKLNAWSFVRLIRDYAPDLVVCDYPLPALIVSSLKEEGRLDALFAIVVIDFHVHAMWLCDHCDRYFVAIEENRAYLETLGIDAEKITATGHPINPAFAETKDPRQMREKYDLREDTPTILVSSGDSGIGPVEYMVKTLMGLRHDAQLVVICGKNAKLKTRLDKLAAQQTPSPRVTLMVVGHTTDMDEYMTASDILVGKAGAMTTFEALAKGLAMVIVNPVPGQEERNADFLLEQAVALRCNNLSMLAHKVDQLLDDPIRLAEMRTRARRLGRPDAAKNIIDKLLTLKTPSAPTRTGRPSND